MLNSNFIRKSLLIILFAGSVGVASAQPEEPQGDPDVPITGVELLIGAGAIWGAKKIIDKRKKV